MAGGGVARAPCRSRQDVNLCSRSASPRRRAARAATYETEAMRRWVLPSAAAGPLALIGGWTLAARRQPAGYDAVRDTISALAADGATDRWIMTAGLAVLGGSYLATAAGLTEAAPAGRALLALGGATTVAVAALPQPTPGHVPAATVAFVSLALWPAASRLPSARAGRAASVALVALLVWFGLELDGPLLGLSERALAAAESLWPLAVAATLARRAACVS